MGVLSCVGVEKTIKALKMNQSLLDQKNIGTKINQM
jgi:hypothetical protein